MIGGRSITRTTLAAFALALMPTFAQAACPRALTGTYSGQAVIFGVEGIVTELIEASFVSPTVATINYLLRGEAGQAYEFSGPTSPDLPRAVEYTYDGRCRGVVTMRNGSGSVQTFHFLAADNGRTLYMMRKKSPADGPPYETTTYTFTRQ